MVVAAEAETVFGQLVGAGAAADAADDAEQAKKVADKLEAIRQGRPLREVAPDVAEGVRFHVLGLAPNAARLSVRFYLEDSFGALAENYQRFLRDVAIEPAPRGPVALWRLLAELAVQGKRENVPPGLAGDWMRAILSGGRYPQGLLMAALMRVRSDQSVNALRAGILRALLTRNEGEEVPVARDIDNEHDAYQLGRLFAVLEAAQYKALGKVNASIADRYYASASSTPARVFAPLLRGLRVHLSDARKQGKRVGWIEDRVAEIVARLPPDLPTSLRAIDQGRFAIGYYHEKSHRPDKDDAPTEELQAEEVIE
jgi:CRISPR-associated protein Csd1